MTKDEALKLALEYIETNAHERRHVRWAIKEALAQPVQEPQVCCGEYDTCLRACTPRGRHLAQSEQEPVDYIASIIACRDALDAQPVPRRWVGLTEDEINACDPSEECWGLHKIARAIEAKLKEKNA